MIPAPNRLCADDYTDGRGTLCPIGWLLRFDLGVQKTDLNNRLLVCRAEKEWLEKRDLPREELSALIRTTDAMKKAEDRAAYFIQWCLDRCIYVRGA